MNWLVITLFAYFFLALEIILDKFLLSSKRVSHQAIYAFYSGSLGMFAMIFIPFGAHSITLFRAVSMITAGIIFIYGMFSMFSALSKSEASRVTPVIGAIIPIIIYFLSMAFLGERLDNREIVGLIFLISGGLWISYDFSKTRERKIFLGFGWSVLAGILLAVSATLFKFFYQSDNFFNVYVWTRVGAFCGALSLFLFPQFRKKLIESIFKFKKPQKEHQKSGIMFVLAKTLGGSGSFLKEKATSLASASVTLVNAMVASEYVLVFILSVVFSLWLPNIFKEGKDWKTFSQKIMAILVIATGVYLVARGR